MTLHPFLQRRVSPKGLPEGPSRRAALVWCAGGVVLALGLLVYLFDRPAWQAQLLSHFLASQGPHHGLGAVGGWLPSFAHTLAFSLFTAELLVPRPRLQVGACAFWFAVNAAFEIGQHAAVRVPLAEALRHSFGQGVIARGLQDYFLRGTFDATDLAAAALGAMVAAASLQRLRTPAQQPATRKLP